MIGAFNGDFSHFLLMRDARFDDFLYNSRFGGLRFFGHFASGCFEQSDMLARHFCGANEHLRAAGGGFAWSRTGSLERYLKTATVFDVSACSSTPGRAER